MKEDTTPHIFGAWPPADVPSLDMPDISSEIDWTLWDSTMQGQTNMLPQQNWASNNILESWIGTNPNIGMTDTGFGNFQDPLDLYSSAFYIPPSN